MEIKGQSGRGEFIDGFLLFIKIFADLEKKKETCKALSNSELRITRCSEQQVCPCTHFQTVPVSVVPNERSPGQQHQEGK